MVDEVQRRGWMRRLHGACCRLPPRPRKIAVTLIGGTLLLLGLAMVVLPGPAFIVIPAGLILLSTEYAWAHRWVELMKRVWHRFRHHPTRHRNDPQERGLRRLARLGFGVPRGNTGFTSR